MCRFDLMEVPYFQTNPDDNSDISTRSALVPVFLALEGLELPSGDSETLLQQYVQRSFGSVASSKNFIGGLLKWGYPQIIPL